MTECLVILVPISAQLNKSHLDVSQCNVNISWLIKCVITTSSRQFINQMTK